jgi:hypothetical protein
MQITLAAVRKAIAQKTVELVNGGTLYLYTKEGEPALKLQIPEDCFQWDKEKETFTNKYPLDIDTVEQNLPADYVFEFTTYKIFKVHEGLRQCTVEGSVFDLYVHGVIAMEHGDAFFLSARDADISHE